MRLSHSVADPHPSGNPCSAAVARTDSRVVVNLHIVGLVFATRYADNVLVPLGSCFHVSPLFSCRGWFQAIVSA